MVSHIATEAERTDAHIWQRTATMQVNTSQRGSAYSAQFSLRDISEDPAQCIDTLAMGSLAKDEENGNDLW